MSVALKGKRERISFAKIPEVLAIPDLISIQKESFEWFMKDGMAGIFKDVSPIEDFTGTMAVEFGIHTFGDPKFDVEECKEKDMSFSAPLFVEVRLINKNTGEIKEQSVFMGDFPLMTEKGTFIFNGTERVVVSQLVRSPGVYFDVERDKDTNRLLYNAKIIPSRGAWLELETDKKDILGVRIDRKRKQPVTAMLQALGFGDHEKLLEIFEDAECIKATMEKDHTTNQEDALIDIYRKLRPGEPPTVDSAQGLLDNLFFNERRYDLARVGRYKLNKKLGLDIPMKVTILTREDILESVRYIVNLHASRCPHCGAKLTPSEGQCPKCKGTCCTIDDIDHFGNRRVRTVGELVQNQVRIGLSRMERVVRERMTTQDVDSITPQTLINIRPVVASIKEFFGSSQLSQFMDQTNPLAGLTHKRRLSALGPGGLSRERAGFEVRDVHPSHYGRMCPIETPEGPNIGLIGNLSTYAKINEFGFLTTPYRKVKKGVVTDEIVYLTADEEDGYIIAQANAPLTKKGRFKNARVLCRAPILNEEVSTVDAKMVDFMDVSPRQTVSVATALIPFLEHDDANRALMGSNMQRQAVPLIRPEAPLVATGMEFRAAKDTCDVVSSKTAGKVTYVDADTIETKARNGKKETYELHKFRRSNQGTCVNQRPIVEIGEQVKRNQVIADGPSTDEGELALGRNILVAFMPWEGYNFEDAIVVSQRLVRDDILTSIHIEEHEVEARSTKLGDEEITSDIPNVQEEVLGDLDEVGVIRVGAKVKAGDVLVGKVTPKGETELTAEEKLLRAIFGEKAREVRDTSLKVPHGESGKVMDVKEFSREAGDELSPGVNQLVRVNVAKRRKIREGDKLAGRHGNKGVIAKVLPIEDMPFMEDGTPVDMVLNPLGVPSRMNIGQVLETHLGWAAYEGFKTEGPDYVTTPVFDGATEDEIVKSLKKAGLPASGKTRLYDGRTGEPFDNDVTVGYIYMLKLIHLVDDKIHARSTGPYSLVTQQPLGGKAQFGGQRFGEMEVWALEAYGAAYALQELLTVKSDDVVGRVKVYEAIVKGENIPEPGIPESFKVLVKEMQSLGLDVEVLSEGGKPIEIQGTEEDVFRTAEELGLDLRTNQPFAGTEEDEGAGDFLRR
ncbi:MAG: DNA-directed RNA polymerase subunit beta [Actinobacteria bacterium]|nr:DNA-directed RNA polymerase subunit beta [Actinomycetota bacterium]MCG2817417.1 DNA-directed RNA polymerase subunit beta [Actinomycetes bacterium]MBU4218678.1 DNA-directed RNA polymerase subunit beta [Actinomycetota bacterium]MBU4359353.1 DNA-directed RNA polymerase subunit beta [Actinomycetota bacterium]MBU4392918.1 DNA-directed RNA polymerase subunit beta [Actinomycetota bacterium]